MEKEKKKPKTRPEITSGQTYKIKTGCGNLFVTINEDEQGETLELFLRLGKSGSCMNSQLEAIGRLCSLSFRLGAEPQEIIKQLRGIRCPTPMVSNEGKTTILSCADATAQILQKYLEKKEKKPVPT